MEPNETPGISEIALAVLAGGMHMCQIKAHNAANLMRWVRESEHPEECTKSCHKYCPGPPGHGTVEFAATLLSEATNECTCGRPNHEWRQDG